MNELLLMLPFRSLFFLLFSSSLLASFNHISFSPPASGAFAIANAPAATWSSPAASTRPPHCSAGGTSIASAPRFPWWTAAAGGPSARSVAALPRDSARPCARCRPTREWVGPSYRRGTSTPPPSRARSSTGAARPTGTTSTGSPAGSPARRPAEEGGGTNRDGPASVLWRLAAYICRKLCVQPHAAPGGDRRRRRRDVYLSNKLFPHAFLFRASRSCLVRYSTAPLYTQRRGFPSV